jgi:hypothetical protein
MALVADIQTSLNQIAANLFGTRRGIATLAVHHAFEDLAFHYADNAGLAFGTHTVTDPASKHPHSAKRIVVFSSKSRKWPARDTQHGFLFDQCWLVFYNSQAPAACEGCLAGFELAMESEFNFDSDDPSTEYTFLQDFRKLVISKARMKVFLFRSNTANAQAATFDKLQAEIRSFGPAPDPTCSYVLCGWCSNNFAYRTIP